MKFGTIISKKKKKKKRGKLFSTFYRYVHKKFDDLPKFYSDYDKSIKLGMINFIYLFIYLFIDQNSFFQTIVPNFNHIHSFILLSGKHN